MDIEKVLLKAKQLLELSNSTYSINEAANAAYKAQELLERHKLSVADLEATSGLLNKEEIVSDKDSLDSMKSKITWKGSLAAQICDINICKCWWAKKSGKNQLEIVGRKSDIDVVRFLYNSIVTQVEILSKASLLKGEGHGKTYSNNFKFGAVSAVISRLRAASNSVRNEYKGTAALVLVNKKEVELSKYIDNLNLKLRSSKTFSARDDSGFNQGLKAGQSISLAKGSLTSKPVGLLK
jgi:hypothetical protein